MKYADYTRNSREPLKRLAHGTRLQSAAAMVPLPDTAMVLDYGCGDGALFEFLAQRVDKDRLVGYEPFLLGEMEMEGIKTYSDAAELVRTYPKAFDVVFCLEVCEHLDQDALTALFANLRACARDSATFVFGVPIETGPSGFFKNVYRTIKGHRQHATFGRALKSLTSSMIPRAADPSGWIGSHIGFDTLYFTEQLRYGGFDVRDRRYLPWPVLGSWINNEVYFICERNERYR